MANALKSAISLVTRPLVTLFSAQASKQDEYRFRDENRPKYEVAKNFVVDGVKDGVNALSEGVDAIVQIF